MFLSNLRISMTGRRHNLYENCKALQLFLQGLATKASSCFKYLGDWLLLRTKLQIGVKYFFVSFERIGICRGIEFYFLAVLAVQCCLGLIGSPFPSWLSPVAPDLSHPLGLWDFGPQ